MDDVCVELKEYAGILNRHNEKIAITSAGSVRGKLFCGTSYRSIWRYSIIEPKTDLRRRIPLISWMERTQGQRNTFIISEKVTDYYLKKSECLVNLLCFLMQKYCTACLHEKQGNQSDPKTFDQWYRCYSISVGLFAARLLQVMSPPLGFIVGYLFLCRPTPPIHHCRGS